MTKNIYVTVMAGGLGKRMKSPLPKVLQKICGQAMIIRLINEIQKLRPIKVIIVVGEFYKLIKEEIEKSIVHREYLDNIVYAIQPEALGTGDAIKATLPYLPTSNVTNIIINGDVPLLQYKTIEQISIAFKSSVTPLMLTGIELDDPSGYGRIIINENGLCTGIIEEKDCTDNQKQIKLVNCAIYICKSEVLHKYIPQISNNNAQSEYYLTDLVKIFYNDTRDPVDLFVLNPDLELEIYNVNTREQVMYVESVLKK